MTDDRSAAQVAQSKILQAHELLGAAHTKLDIYHTRGTDPLKRLAATEAAREAKDLLDDACELLRTGRRPRFP